jgi:pyruvate/2-oxoglutarate dehydrogenase complex dihydrolipoamide acyltransferase (E2) component
VVSLQNGVPVERSVMTMSATFDHRVVDGGDAGRFLTQLRDHLQVPAIGFL